jgi:hypothetical protein
VPGAVAAASRAAPLAEETVAAGLACAPDATSEMAAREMAALTARDGRMIRFTAGNS